MALMSVDQGDGLDSNSAGNAENDESSYLKDKQGGEDAFDEDQELYDLFTSKKNSITDMFDM